MWPLVQSDSGMKHQLVEERVGNADTETIEQDGEALLASPLDWRFSICDTCIGADPERGESYLFLVIAPHGCDNGKGGHGPRRGLRHERHRKSP